MNAFACSPVAAFFLALLATAASSLRAAPIGIDNFSVDVALTQSNSFADGGDKLGGEGDYLFVSGLDGAFEVSGGSAKLNPVEQDGQFYFVYDGDDGASSVTYSGLGGVDLTDGGKNDHIEIRFTEVTGTVAVGVTLLESSTDGLNLVKPAVTQAGTLRFHFDEFTPNGSGADFAAAGALIVNVVVERGDRFQMASIRAAGPPGPVIVAADSIRPSLRLLKKSALNTPRPRHKIKGTASDNDEVDRVEVKSRGKGWKKAKLRGNGRWKFKTPRLGTGKNLFKLRAWDNSGNRSKIKKAKPVGV